MTRTAISNTRSSSLKRQRSPRGGASITLQARTGYTLLELLLVMAIIGLVLGISWPSLRGYFEDSRLGEGVDQVHRAWVVGRTLALEEGRPYRFGWESNSNRFRVAPDGLEYWPDLGGTRLESVSGSALDADAYPWLCLPDGVGFAGDGLASPASESVALSGSILFWPDGTARIHDPEGFELPEALVIITNRQGSQIGLRLRGVTGVVTTVNIPVGQPMGIVP